MLGVLPSSWISIHVPNCCEFTLGPRLGYRPPPSALLPPCCSLHWKERWVDQKRAEKSENHNRGYAVEHACWQFRYISGMEMLRHYSWNSYPACGTFKFISCRPHVIPGVNNSGSLKPCNWVCFQLYWSFLVRGPSRSLTLWKSSEYHLKKNILEMIVRKNQKALIELLALVTIMIDWLIILCLITG